ncbi:MAG: hypothetical protein IT184_14305 [Acidobacteria bacterium]|nr:hypothetical protein [Acidobacteriota bacterium]
MSPEAPSPARPAPLPRLLAALVVIVFAAVLVRTAWIGDDMLISLRAVLNVTHGFGLTYNIAERVQAFTHPLWVLLVTLAYLVGGNLLLGTLALAGALSVAVVWLVLTRATTAAQAAAAGVVLLFSNAFVDYSTSGLENPLSHALIVALVLGAMRAEHCDREGVPGGWADSLATLWSIESLLYLTRPDLVLIGAPLVVFGSLRARSVARVARAAAIGTTPALAWTLFSLVYYGFPFPNTAYAKLGAGIGFGPRWTQGWLYAADSIDRDPLTLVATAFAVLLGLSARHAVARLLAVGIALYLVYVVSIGGDFMSGRFFSAPLLASALIVGWMADRPQAFWVAATTVLVAVGLSAAHVPLLNDSRFDDPGIRKSGIVDERGTYFKERSVVRGDRRTFRSPGWPMNTGAAIRPRVVPVCGLAGAAGLEQGPFVHVLDECALTDPLLARLPAVYNDEWRIGHLRRTIPDGYEASLASDANLLTDPALKQFYDRIRLITRGRRLLAPERLRAIAGMTTGRYDALVNVPYYRHERALVPLDSLADVKENGTAIDAPGVRRLTGPLAVSCEDEGGRRYYEVSLTASASYRLVFLKRNQHVGAVEIGAVPEHRRPQGLAVHYGDVPPLALRGGFDVVVVEPLSDGGGDAIGHLLLDGTPATDALLRERRARLGEPVQ